MKWVLWLISQGHSPQGVLRLNGRELLFGEAESLWCKHWRALPVGEKCHTWMCGVPKGGTAQGQDCHLAKHPHYTHNPGSECNRL